MKSKKKPELVKKIQVEDRSTIGQEEYEDLTFCEVCNLSNREDRMLLCDRCDRGYHCNLVI